MMGKFNFEDYRQAWETGPHWELKREFIESYQDMFEEDRLLCLAQAYSNVVLMNCSYPDPVMRQISELAKPLQMRKKFQETNSSTEASTPTNEQQRVAGKMKSIYEQAGRPFKQVKFCASEDQNKSADSTNPSQSSSVDCTNPPQSSSADCTNPSQSSPEEFQSSNHSSMPSQQSSQSLLQAFVVPSLGVTNEPQTAPLIDDNILLEKDKNRIISKLGLPFIQKFVKMIKIIQDERKHFNAAGALLQVSKKLGEKDSACFKFDIDPDSPDHARRYISKFFIKNCEISSKLASKKKESKSLCAKSAVDTLIKLSISHVSANDSKPQLNSISQSKSHEVIECMKLFCENINKNRDRNKNEPAIVILKTAASLLDMENCISFDTTSHQVSPTETEYCCKFYFKGILISTGKSNKSDVAKNIAAKLGLKMLSNLSEYEIQKGELIKKECSNSNNASTSDTYNSSLSNSYVETNVEKPSFVLNRTMYDLSLRDGFMVLEKEKYRDGQIYSRSILSESASFNHKTYEYQFEDVPGTTSPSTKAILLIGGVAVGSGTGVGKEEAKIIACKRALINLKKKYYTLRVKEENLEGFIITRNQVFEGESFSSNVISDSNIGCKMLKNMGWTGGGLGGRGIAEPIQATSKLSLGSGLGFEDSKRPQDLQLFRKRLGAMLREFCNSENYSDLVFSKDFTKEERKHIHQLAVKSFHLHTQSRGVGEDRFLTIRQKYDSLKLLTFLANNGGSYHKFQLIDDSEFSLDI